VASELSDWFEAFAMAAPGRIGDKLRVRMARRKAGRAGTQLFIDRFVSVRGWENLSLGERVGIGRGCIIECRKGSLSIGDDTTLNSNVTLGADFGSITIGRSALIAMNVVIRAANHRFDRSPQVPIRQQGHDSGPVVIGDDVWLGANVVVLPNVTIGAHSVVAAGSVVNRDIPAGSLAAGAPARVVRSLGGSGTGEP
jgi:galactoside O-acetyltransferase